MNLKIALERAQRSGRWLHRKLRDSGFKVSLTKVYGWIDSDPSYRPPNPKEERKIREVLR